MKSDQANLVSRSGCDLQVSEAEIRAAFRGQVGEHEMQDRAEDNAGGEMPRYKCHKEVWALKIKDVHVDHPSCKEDGAALMTPTDTAYAPFLVSADYVERHKPQVGGYYVVYDDGYKSYSPAAPFEAGYSLAEPNALELGAAVRAAGQAGA